MLDISTLYLLLVMVSFLFVAIVLVHHHKNDEIVRRKSGEVEAFVARLNQKIEILERDIVNLRIKADELDEEINNFETSK